MWLINVLRASARLAEHDDRLRKLEGELEQANLDWDNLYDQCRKLMGRVAKERARMEELQTESPTDATPASGNHTPAGRHFVLSPRAQQAQAEIMRRRAGG